MTTTTEKVYNNGVPFTLEQIKAEKTSDLLKVYNKVAKSANAPEVARFADHATAVRRTWDILKKSGGGPRKAKSADKKVRQKVFNYTAVGAPRARREETSDIPVLRDRIVKALLRPEGMTFNQAIEIVNKFDRDIKTVNRKTRNSGLTVPVRAYEAIRLVHNYLNLSLRQAEPYGDETPIHIVPNRKA